MLPDGPLFGHQWGVEPNSTVTTFVEVPARLSWAQKRDLAGQAVAAVVTTALIAAPFITPPPGSRGASSEPTLPAQSFVGVAAAVSVADADPISVVRPRARAAARPARARLETRLVANAGPAVAIQAEAIGTSGASGSVAVAEMDVDRETQRKPLARKLTGWLTGDGTHAIRPFPTVATRQ